MITSNKIKFNFDWGGVKAENQKKSTEEKILELYGLRVYRNFPCRKCREGHFRERETRIAIKYNFCFGNHKEFCLWGVKKILSWSSRQHSYSWPWVVCEGSMRNKIIGQIREQYYIPSALAAHKRIKQISNASICPKGKSLETKM